MEETECIEVRQADVKTMHISLELADIVFPDLLNIKITTDQTINDWRKEELMFSIEF